MRRSATKQKIVLRSIKSQLVHTAELTCFLMLMIAGARLAVVMLPDYGILNIVFWGLIIVFICSAVRLFLMTGRYLKLTMED